MDETTFENIADDLNAYFDDGPEPSPDDGWFTVNQAMTLPVFRGQTVEGVRHLLNRRVERGELERREWGRFRYYRIPRDV
jgi:hypothetical protein